MDLIFSRLKLEGSFCLQDSRLLPNTAFHGTVGSSDPVSHVFPVELVRWVLQNPAMVRVTGAQFVVAVNVAESGPELTLFVRSLLSGHFCQGVYSVPIACRGLN